jgi:hypothetical protein
VSRSMQMNSSRSALAEISTPLLEVGQLLMAALDDSQIGLLICDAQIRLLHITSQIPRLIELQSDEPIESLDVLQLLSRSALDKSSRVSSAI